MRSLENRGANMPADPSADKRCVCTRPRNLEDLAVQVAIVRPGPIVGGAVNPYVRRREMLREVPGAYFNIGNGGPGSCEVHNPGYDFNDEALVIGASYWARLAETALAG